MAQALRVVELDFETYKTNLKNFLSSQTEFQDYDFDGAGLSILIDILAYNSYYQAYYLNSTASEMFLDSAQLRSSVVSLAKMIGYVPGSNQGALSRLNLKITPSNSEPQSITQLFIDKYTKLLGSDLDGVNYPFVTISANSAPVSVDGSFNFTNVYIKQGEVVTRQYLMDSSTNPTREFLIPSSNVDTTTISVAVQQSASNAATFIYNQNEDIVSIDGNSQVFFLEENENQTYTIQFGDNVLGKQPDDGSVVIITYLDNVGDVANNVSKFVFIDPIGGQFSDNVIISGDTSSFGGVPREDIDDVKFRAPYYYTTQNRAVTYADYKTLLLKNYNYIDAIAVWGGEDADPVVYGKVYLSIKTKGNYFLTNFEKLNLTNDLVKTFNIVTVTPEIVEPDYVYLGLKCNINYDPNLTNLSQAELEQRVRLVIGQYSDTELNKFESVFRRSRLQAIIEAVDPSIQSSELSVTVQKQIQFDFTRIRNYTTTFNMPLARSSIDSSITTYPYLEMLDTNGITRNCYIEEIPQSLSGIDSISIVDSGRNYISAPTVQIIGDGSGATATAKIAGGRVTSITVTNPGSNYSYAVVTILSNDDGDSAAAVPVLQRNVGQLRSYYYSTSGEKVVLRNNVGTIDFLTGTIAINGIRVFSIEQNEFFHDDIMVITANAGAENIQPLRNRILTIDITVPRSVQITATPL